MKKTRSMSNERSSEVRDAWVNSSCSGSDMDVDVAKSLNNTEN